MKAATYDASGPPEVLRYVDVPDPVCASDGVVIRVRAVSVEGGDVINRATAAPPHPAYVVGYAAAGEVVEVGRDVTGFRVGQAATTVAMDGSHAEFRAAPARTTWAVPEGLDLAAAAALPIAFGTAHRCLHTAGHLQAGQTVLIQAGAGGVGLAAIQLAHRAGARVLATVSGEARAERLARLGLDAVIDHRREDVAEAALRLTGGCGADLVVDPVGGRTLAGSLASLRPGGRLVFVGNAGGGDLSVDLWPALQANLTLAGVFMGPLFEIEEVHRDVAALLDEAARGEVEVVIDRTFPLAEAARAHQHAAEGAPLGRVVLVP